MVSDLSCAFITSYNLISVLHRGSVSLYICGPFAKVAQLVESAGWRTKVGVAKANILNKRK